MACCGRGNNKAQKFPPAVPSPKAPLRVSKQNCVSCGGTLEKEPAPVQVGNRILVKNKCTKCGRVYYSMPT